MRLPSIAAATAVATAAIAAAAPAAHAEERPPRALVGARVGGIVPFGGLSPFVTGGVEVGYVLPVARGRVAIVLAIDYTRPTATGREMDPRVTGGSYTWKLTQQELGIMPVVLYRMSAMRPVAPYAGIGPRVLLLESTVEDDGMPVIGATTETSTKIGIGVPLGVELPLGPGRLVGEVLLQYGDLDHVATGDAHTGAASLAVGYRALF